MNKLSKYFPGLVKFFALAMIVSLVCGNTHSVIRIVPAGFLPAPRRLPPCFDFEAVPGACGFIGCNFRVSKDQAFSVSSFNGSEQFREIGLAADAELDGLNDVIAWTTGHPLSPVTSSSRDIEALENDFIAEPTVFSCQLGSVICAAVVSTPDFAVKMDAYRERISEPLWSFDVVSAASPEHLAIPVTTATVELFRDEPTVNGLPTQIKVAPKCHHSFVHGDYDTDTVLIVNTGFQA